MNKKQESKEALVSALVGRWQETRTQGKAPTPEELCAAHPELLPQ